MTLWYWDADLRDLLGMRVYGEVGVYDRLPGFPGWVHRSFMGNHPRVLPEAPPTGVRSELT